ncbi:hypothetical protein AKO1_009860, partial [Acrasis kona]
MLSICWKSMEDVEEINHAFREMQEESSQAQDISEDHDENQNTDGGLSISDLLLRFQSMQEESMQEENSAQIEKDSASIPNEEVPVGENRRELHSVRCDYDLQYVIVNLHYTLLLEKSEQKEVFYILQDESKLVIDPSHFCLNTEVQLCDLCFDFYQETLSEQEGSNKQGCLVVLNPMMHQNVHGCKRVLQILLYKFDVLTTLFYDFYNKDQLRSASVVLIQMLSLSDRIGNSNFLHSRYHDGQVRIQKLEQVLMGFIALYRKSKNLQLLLFFKERFLLKIIRRSNTLELMLEYMFFNLESGLLDEALDSISAYQNKSGDESPILTGYLGVLHFMKLETIIIPKREDANSDIDMLGQSKAMSSKSIANITNAIIALRFLESYIVKIPDSMLFVHHLGKLYLLMNRLDDCEQLFKSFYLSDRSPKPQAGMQYLKFLLARPSIQQIHDSIDSTLSDLNEIFTREDHHNSAIESTINADEIIMVCRDIIKTDPVNIYAITTLIYLIQVEELEDKYSLLLFVLQSLWTAIEFVGVGVSSAWHWKTICDVLYISYNLPSVNYYELSVNFGKYLASPLKSFRLKKHIDRNIIKRENETFSECFLDQLFFVSLFVKFEEGIVFNTLKIHKYRYVKKLKSMST